MCLLAGDGTTLNRFSATLVPGLPAGVTLVSAGGAHTCAALSNNASVCWGRNNNGQLADNSTTDRLSPVEMLGVGGEQVVSFAMGSYHTCVVLSSSRGLRCVGANTYGQLGDGSSAPQRSVLVDVVGLTSGVSQVSAGDSHTCALLSTGQPVCWGFNGQGRLGVFMTEIACLLPAFNAVLCRRRNILQSQHSCQRNRARTWQCSVHRVRWWPHMCSAECWAWCPVLGSEQFWTAWRGLNLNLLPNAHIGVNVVFCSSGDHRRLLPHMCLEQHRQRAVLGPKLQRATRWGHRLVTVIAVLSHSLACMGNVQVMARALFPSFLPLQCHRYKAPLLLCRLVLTAPVRCYKMETRRAGVTSA